MDCCNDASPPKPCRSTCRSLAQFRTVQGSAWRIADNSPNSFAPGVSTEEGADNDINYEVLKYVFEDHRINLY